MLTKRGECPLHGRRPLRAEIGGRKRLACVSCAESISLRRHPQQPSRIHPRRVVTKHFYLSRDGIKSFDYVHGKQNRVPVVRQTSVEAKVALVTFHLECGHVVRRIVVDRPGYRPRSLWCEKCGNCRGASTAAAAKRQADAMASKRPFSLVYPCGKGGG